MEFLVYIMVFGFTGFMIYNFLNVSKRVNKNKKLIKLINVFEDKSLFNNEYENFIMEINDSEFTTKAKIIKIWNDIYFNEFEKALKLAKTLDFKLLLDKKGNIRLNEDSLYYYLLASTNRLYSKEKQEMIKEFNELLTIKDNIKDTLIYQIYMASLKLYFNEDDKGEKFLKDVINNNFNKLKFSRIMLGFYKNISVILLTKIYLDNKNNEKIDELKEELNKIKDTVICKRYMEELKIKKIIDEKLS